MCIRRCVALPQQLTAAAAHRLKAWVPRAAPDRAGGQRLDAQINHSQLGGVPHAAMDYDAGPAVGCRRAGQTVTQHGAPAAALRRGVRWEVNGGACEEGTSAVGGSAGVSGQADGRAAVLGLHGSHAPTSGQQSAHLRLPPASTTRTCPAPGPSISWLTNMLLVWHFTVTACPEKLRRPPKSLQVDTELAASSWIEQGSRRGARPPP
jgi:hypothetical protein